MAMEPGFRNIKEGFTGFYIWRVEKMKIVPVPADGYGKFYNGDAYIIYACTEYGQAGGVHMKVKPHKGMSIEQHIHFWLGENASQDEVTVAAYKSVELDDSLGGFPVQHREVQGSESKRFMSYFKDGVRVLQGGVATGLSHVETAKSPKLFIVKGKRQPVIRQLPTISWKEFNDGDVFVLDTMSHIFVWIGKNANRLERLQASKFATKLKEEHFAEIVNVDDGQEGKMSNDERLQWDQFLPMSKKEVRPASPDDDQKMDVMTRKLIKLYLCSDESGSLHIKEVKGGPLEQSDLDSNDAFIIDNGQLGIWVWIGKKATRQERAEAMRNAQGFIKKKGYPDSTPITRVIDGGEPPEFRSLFRKWTDKYQTKSFTYQRKHSQTVQTKFDASTLHDQPKLAADSGMVDDGSGAKEIFRVDNFDLVQVPDEEHGKFYSGDCYVILYAYSTGTQDRFIIYFWLGQKSSQDERGTAALKAVELDDRLGGLPVQVRVVEGKEPNHFLAMFQGKLKVFQGGLSSSFEGGPRQELNEGDNYLMQVHGNTPLSTVAIQVPLEAASLNTNDCFVLVTKKETWVWMGKGATGDEREVAKTVGEEAHKANDTNVVFEGQEKDVFWSALGGKGPYKDERTFGKNDNQNVMPRLFHGSNASGSFKIEEILDFTQADLVTEDVMLLDVGNAIFVWLGKDSNENEKKLASDAASDYLSSDPTGRDKDIPVIVTKQGNEPPHFTGNFGAWDPTLWDNMVY